MRALLPVSLSFLSLAGASLADTTITVDAGRGPVTVRVPDSYDPATPLPMVMLLHGYCSTGPQQELYMQFAQFVDGREFVYLFPTGLFDGNCNYWNGTPACCAFVQQPDDSSYLASLIDAVKAQLSIDPGRVHLVGHSNGGFMSYRMACDHAGVIASVASLAGATFRNLSSCLATEPVHVLQIHGTLDTVIEYDGGSIGGVPYPSAQLTIDNWLAIDGCAPTPVAGAPLDIDTSLAGAETTVEIWSTGCAPGGSAELWTIQDGTHVPPLDIGGTGFSASVLDWFETHGKAELGTSYCISDANSTGKPARLFAFGSSSVSAGAPLTIVGSNLPAGAIAATMFATSTLQIPALDGTFCLGAGAAFVGPILTASPGGEARYTLSAPQNPALVGFVGNFQQGYLDPLGGPNGVNFTDGRSITLTP